MLTLPPGLHRAAELPPAPRAPEVQPELRPNRNWNGADTEMEPERVRVRTTAQDLLIIVLMSFLLLFFFFLLS